MDSDSESEDSEYEIDDLDLTGEGEQDIPHSSSVIKLRSIMRQEPLKRKHSATVALNDIVTQLDYAQN